MSLEGSDAPSAWRDVLRAVLSAWRVRVGLALTAVIAVACWTNPLTDHLGFASALVAAASIAPIAMIMASSLARSVQRRSLDVPPARVAIVAGGLGFALTLVFALLAAIHGAFTLQCRPGRGLLFFALLTLPGTVLAPLVGAVLGASTQRRWLAIVASAATVPAFIAWSAVRFYASPAVFAYDPFFGFFPGALYDESVPLTVTLATYRLGTFAWIVATAACVHVVWPSASRAARIASPRVAPGAWTAMCAAALVGIAIYVAGPALGHRYTASEIARELGGRLDGRRCIVVYDRSIPGRDARRMQRDCDVRVEQLEHYFGVHLHERVTVFLFESAAQKQALMGAADTYIAKPWRHEIYLQHAAFPHPVLKHELAHVVTREMAGGPFHVSSRWGVLPLPGLVEGAAVAGGWEGESDATPHQWSRAMLDAHMLPRVTTLGGLGFYLHAAGTAYTAAGSFSRWLIERYGAARYRVLYRNGDFANAYGMRTETLESQWHAFLRTVDVPERINTRARVRFRRAAIFARACPQETAELYDHAVIRLAGGDIERARGELQEVVRNDPTDVHARVSLAEALARTGAVDRAAALADAADRDLGIAAGVRLRARIADVLWRWRGPDAARALYARVDTDLFDEDDARTLEVKQWSLGVRGPPPDGGYASAVRDLLVGVLQSDPSPTSAVARLALLFRGAERGDVDAPAAYLIARQYATHERHEDALSLLRSIDPARLPTDRVRVETQRLLAMSAYLAGDLASARATYAAIAGDPARSQSQRDVASDFVDRIDRELRAR